MYDDEYKKQDIKIKSKKQKTKIKKEIKENKKVVNKKPSFSTIDTKEKEDKSEIQRNDSKIKDFLYYYNRNLPLIMLAVLIIILVVILIIKYFVV